MIKYKCLNPDCNNVWVSSEESFECPVCHGVEFEPIGGGGNRRWLKMAGIAVGILVALIVLFKACGNNGDTTVTIDPDQKHCKMTVTLSGDYKDDYRIILRKGGAVFGKHERKDKVVFSDLNGTYSLDVQYVGKEKLPKINGYQRTFTFTKPPEAPEAPQITYLAKTPDRLTKSKKVYTVKVNTDPGIVPISETEFSVDGTIWQKSNVFPNLEADTYTFYARNARDESMQDEKQLVLEAFVPTPPPTVAQLDNLLKEVMSCDDKASDEMKRLLGNNLPVHGVSNISNVQQLVTDACVNGKLYKVTNIDLNNDGDVISITVN